MSETRDFETDLSHEAGIKDFRDAGDRIVRLNTELEFFAAAFGKDLQTQFAALMQTIPDIDGTEIILAVSEIRSRIG